MAKSGLTAVLSIRPTLYQLRVPEMRPGERMSITKWLACGGEVGPGSDYIVKTVCCRSVSTGRLNFDFMVVRRGSR